MNLYESEVGSFPFPRSEESIKAIAKVRGSQSGYLFAESFELVYELIK
jgi:N-acetylglucosamine malate deacetylase 1